jgi:hypothetical protein
MEEELERLEELEAAEGQIEWFEKTRVDKDKKPRYANLNLKEIKEGDYQQQLANRLAQKRA